MFLDYVGLMKARLIEYSYDINDFDQCKGSRTWTERKKALVFRANAKEVLILRHDSRTYFAMRDLRRRNGGFSLRDGDGFPIVTPRGQKNVKTLRKTNITNELARDIISALEWLRKANELRDACKKILAEHGVV